MTSLVSERSWLLDPGLLKLVHQCRRLIRSEFGVKLHLTEENLEQQLAEYASKTRSSHLMRTWATLQEKVPQLSVQTERAGSEEAPKRMYRGQEIAEDTRPVTANSEESEEDPPRKKKVIYRGQVVG
ncbi:hypothetical protein KFJ24_17690 [Marinobacter sediminum]|uniref:hypothetical protein n=1 Tax=Marinobacter sediminum TaxID=256323 RepID=UPI0020306314|nr:hypothetical protein [Marinobacter sediminum]MCM0614326.1 hypothetical protein [Marinobacter sediminum]